MAVYSLMHYLKCKCFNKQGCLKIPCCTTLCNKVTISISKHLTLIQADIDMGFGGQIFLSQDHTGIKVLSTEHKISQNADDTTL